mgnify:CR=1 FL=1
MEPPITQQRQQQEPRQQTGFGEDGQPHQEGGGEQAKEDQNFDEAEQQRGTAGELSGMDFRGERVILRLDLDEDISGSSGETPIGQSNPDFSGGPTSALDAGVQEEGGRRGAGKQGVEGVVALILHSVLADVPVRGESDQLPQREEGGEGDGGSSSSAAASFSSYLIAAAAHIAGDIAEIQFEGPPLEIFGLEEEGPPPEPSQGGDELVSPSSDSEDDTASRSLEESLSEGNSVEVPAKRVGWVASPDGGAGEAKGEAEGFEPAPLGRRACRRLAKNKTSRGKQKQQGWRTSQELEGAQQATEEDLVLQREAL